MKRLLLIVFASLLFAVIIVSGVVLRYGTVKGDGEGNVLTLFLDTPRGQVDFISRFYSDLYTSAKKDSIVKSCCTDNLLKVLSEEYEETIEDWDGWNETEEFPRYSYAKWLFFDPYMDIDFSYVDRVVDITPLSKDWYQVYVDEQNYHGDKLIVYMRIVNEKGGYKIDKIQYSLPRFETRIEELDFIEKSMLKYVCWKIGYTISKNVFESGLIWVGKDGKYGCINQYGKEIFPCKYDSEGKLVSRGEEDDKYGLPTDILYKVLLNGKYGLEYIVGETLQPCKYEEIGDMTNSHSFKVKFKGKYGYIDTTPREPKILYDYVGDFETSRQGVTFAKVKRNGKYGFIRESDYYEFFPCQYDAIDEFEQHGDYILAEVVNNRKAGYLNEYFVELVPCRYSILNDFVNGYCAVFDGEKWGYVNEYGSEFIPCILDYAGDFNEYGNAYVGYQGAEGKLYESGRFVESWESAHKNDAPLPTKTCEVCGGSGRIAIRGGGMVLDYQNCNACFGTGRVSVPFGRSY